MPAPEKGWFNDVFVSRTYTQGIYPVLDMCRVSVQNNGLGRIRGQEAVWCSGGGFGEGE